MLKMIVKWIGIVFKKPTFKEEDYWQKVVDDYELMESNREVW